MKLLKNLEQRTEDWFKIRQGSIGGTRAKKVVSSTNTSLMYELIAERGTGMIQDSFVSEAMQRGIISAYKRSDKNLFLKKLLNHLIIRIASQKFPPQR